MRIILNGLFQGDFWWHGSLQQDGAYKTKLTNLKFIDKISELAMNEQGAYDKIRFEFVNVEGWVMNLPRDIDLFLRTPTTFIECDKTAANRFFVTYGRDESSSANLFRHRVRKILANTKVVLDALGIPFWICSGTLLGRKKRNQKEGKRLQYLIVSHTKPCHGKKVARLNFVCSENETEIYFSLF